MLYLYTQMIYHQGYKLQIERQVSSGLLACLSHLGILYRFDFAQSYIGLSVDLPWPAILLIP